MCLGLTDQSVRIFSNYGPVNNLEVFSGNGRRSRDRYSDRGWDFPSDNDYSGFRPPPSLVRRGPSFRLLSSREPVETYLSRNWSGNFHLSYHPSVSKSMKKNETPTKNGGPRRGRGSLVTRQREWISGGLGSSRGVGSAQGDVC